MTAPTPRETIAAALDVGHLWSPAKIAATATHALRKHRDDIARALYLDDCRGVDIDPDSAAAAWTALKDDGVTRRVYRERADAVLDLLDRDPEEAA